MVSTRLTGRWCQPVNTAADQAGGIHDDETATRLGFDGGTVAGSIHMEQFLPLVLQTFGDAWWRDGVLSLYFRQATTHLQPVRCHLEPAASGQARVWMENEHGDVITEGTANLRDCAVPTALSQRLATLRPAGELRILAAFATGQQATAPARVDAAFVDRQLTVITEPHESFVTTAAFGGRVLPCTQVVRVFDAAEQHLARAAAGPFVGLYGGIEIEFGTGPVLADTDYESVCEVVGLSDSPKTEILWRRSSLFRQGHPVARMLKMDRLMKDSSPLWGHAVPPGR